MLRRKTYMYLMFGGTIIAFTSFLSVTKFLSTKNDAAFQVKIAPRFQRISLNFRATQATRRHIQRQACTSLGFYYNKTYGLDGILQDMNYLRNIYVSERYQILFCLVPKAGSNNWVRTLLTLEGAINSTDALTPPEVTKASHQHLRVLGQYGPEQKLHMIQNFTSVIFVRNPYPRLLSAFRDRLETYPNRNPSHRQIHNKKIYMMYGHHSPGEIPPETSNEKYNVTFQEFVDYYLAGNTDVHWREQYKVCPPCLGYDYIGKIETYAADFKQIIKIYDAYSEVPFVRAPHATNSSQDAILRKYYSTLSDTQMEKLEKLLSPDMKLFGYTIPEAIKRNLF